MKCVFIQLCLTLICFGMNAQNTKVIAHRGYWKKDGSAQNSISALQNAAELKVYGSEFDVWLTGDNRLVVNHDKKFQGHDMEHITFAEAVKVKLGNGESMPTLSEYFSEALDHPELHLILELKSHVSDEREKEAVLGIAKLIKAYGVADRTDFIAFSLNAVKEFVKVMPGADVYYLEGDMEPAKLKEIGCAGLDYNIHTIKTHPEWIKEAHDLGLKVNVWTVNNREDMEFLIAQGVDFITTDEPQLLMEILEEK